MLNKKLLFLLALFTSPFVFCKKNNASAKNKNTHQTTIQLSFVSEQSQTPTDVISQETFDYCTDVLKKLSSIQKQRRLTLEEITLAMRAIIFLYLVPSDDYSKHIAINIDEKELVLPYSEDLLAEILGKPTNTEPSNEQ